MGVTTHRDSAQALDESDEPIRAAIAEVRASGTTLVGEVTNTLASYEALAQSALSAAVFFEQLGFRTGDARGLAGAAQATIDRLPANRRLRVSVVPHAPYSVSPALLQAIASQGARPIRSIHLGESPEELQFLQDGSGAWRGLLDGLGVWDDAWAPPQCGPVAYLDQLGLVDDRLLAVHGVQLTDAELERLAAAHATVVTCPRSNSWTGAGTPPLERFYRSGVRVAVGTDSLASVETLNVFDELARMREIAPAISASTLLGDCDAQRGGSSRIRRRTRDDRTWQARGAHCRAAARSCCGCGRIPGEWHPAAGHRVAGRPLSRQSDFNVNRLRTYGSFVRFSHSVFALPFALTGALLAINRNASGESVETIAVRALWIVVAMVAARSAAMGFNRLVDANFDALNPRTATRELPRGVMSKREAILFVVVASIVFIFSAWRLGPLCFALSPVALAIVFWYSLAKRVTSYTQLFLGLAMAVAPVGGWLAAGGRGGWEPWLLGAGDRLLGRRLRCVVCLPGSRRRPCPGAALDPRAFRHRAIADDFSSHARGCCGRPGGAGTRRGPWLVLPGGSGRRCRTPGLRTIPGFRAGSIASQTSVRSQWLRGHPLPRDDRRRRVRGVMSD